MRLTIDLDSQTADEIRILRRCERVAESQAVYYIWESSAVHLWQVVYSMCVVGLWFIIQ